MPSPRPQCSTSCAEVGRQFTEHNVCLKGRIGNLAEAVRHTQLAAAVDSLPMRNQAWLIGGVFAVGMITGCTTTDSNELSTEAAREAAVGEIASAEAGYGGDVEGITSGRTNVQGTRAAVEVLVPGDSNPDNPTVVLLVGEDGRWRVVDYGTFSPSLSDLEAFTPSCARPDYQPRADSPKCSW